MKKIHLFALLLLMPVLFAYANEDFWMSAGVDAAFFDYSYPAYSGSLSIGYGTGSAIGLKLSYFFIGEVINTLELNIFFRIYIFGMESYEGPFVQLMGGPALFNRTGEVSVPSYAGTFSASLCFGWRFNFAEKFFAEAAVRGGFPFFAGIGVFAGVRF
ncbi:MAG: hypothetical protein FWD28_02615 [Treponema sp.]|nr:hypothetical protein [Treponema sp.]